MADSNIQLGEAIEQFLKSPQAPPGARTDLLRFTMRCGRDCPMFMLTASDVKGCVMEVKKAADRRKRADVLEKFFEFGKDKGWVRVNLATGLIKTKESRKKATAPKRQKVQLSEEGRESIEAEMEQLLKEKQRVIDEVKAAREEGDLKENAGYHDARERLAIIEARLRESADILARAVPLE